MRRAWWLGLAVLVAACGSTPPSPPASTPARVTPTTAPVAPAVPWIDATPSPEPSAASVPAGTPACTASRVLVQAGWQGATGSMAGSVWVTNEGSGPCALAGPPHLVRLMSGEVALSPLRYVAEPGADPEAAGPAAPVLVPPGGRAWAELVWANLCSAMRPVVTAVLVTLPDGSGPVRAEPMEPVIDGLPRCDVPGKASTLTAYAFRPEEPAALAKPPVSVVIAAPATAAPGRDLDYLVTLTNTGTDPADLEPCPVYTESIVAGGAALKAADRRLLLNCAGMGGAIAPGASVTLGMRISVPADAPAGLAELRWTLEPDGPLAQDPTANTAAIMITGG